MIQFSELQKARSGGTGRRAGLKIQWYLVPCGFDPLLRDQQIPALPIDTKIGNKK